VSNGQRLPQVGGKLVGAAYFYPTCPESHVTGVFDSLWIRSPKESPPHDHVVRCLRMRFRKLPDMMPSNCTFL